MQKWEYLTLKSKTNYGTTKFYINDQMQSVDDDADSWDGCFYTKVMKLPQVYKVDYNGHFGYNLFVSIEQPAPSDIFDQIAECITQHITP